MKPFYMANPPQSRTTPSYHAHVNIVRLPDCVPVACLHPEDAEVLARKLNNAAPADVQGIIDETMKGLTR